MSSSVRWIMLAVLLLNSSFVQARTGRIAGGVEVSNASGATLRVEMITDRIARIRVSRTGKFAGTPSWAVLPEMQSRRSKPRVSVGNGSVAVSSDAMRITVDARTLQATIADPHGNVLNADAAAPQWQGTHFTVWKRMPDGEAYYGLGDKATFNHREKAFTMWNTDFFGWQESDDPLYKAIPFFVALRQRKGAPALSYGIFLDNTWRTFFDFGKQARDRYAFGSDGGELDYYFFAGPTPKQVVQDYTELTGRTPLPALYTLAYQQARYSYYPEARVREVARMFRERKIPADIIYLDIDYQRDNRPFTVDPEKFPDWTGMIRDLDRQGWRMVAITDLHIKKEQGYAPYDSGHAGDHFVKNPDGSEYVGVVWPGPSVFPDFTLTRTREWWGTLYKEFVSQGIAGFWNDMNEPAVFERADKTMPLETRHRFDDGRVTDHREVHNIFGMQNVRATYEGLLKLQPDKRPFVLTRAAYAGTQRFAASWTGDNSSSWNHYRLTVPTLLNLGISGYANVGVDIGGFWGSPEPDLLTRWIQLGVFNPVFRNHTAKDTADQEPWVHGPDHEAIRRRYIELRYRLLPYIYTSMEETARTGLPLMRPVFLEYPNMEGAMGEKGSFFFGPRMLVAAPEWEFLKEYDVNLPPGEWFNYWTGERVPGGKKIKVAPKLDEVPVFIRAGTVLPQQPVVQHTREVPEGPLELRVYPGADCSGALYADDGETFAYKQGKLLRMAFSCTADAAGVTITGRAETNAYTPWWKAVEVRVFGVAKQPSRVTVGGTAITDFAYDAVTRTVAVRQAGTVPAEVRVEF